VDPFPLGQSGHDGGECDLPEAQAISRSALSSPAAPGWLLARRAGLALLLAAAQGPAIPGVLAQVVPGGLGTRVNGTALGGCGNGVCKVKGGTTLGGTLFHRFRQFDTRHGIRQVDLDTRGRSNVVVGVSHPAGTFFGAPLRLSDAASLFWLSPGGIWLGRGGQILGATNLLLSTAPTLRIGGGVFEAAGGLGDGPGDLGDGSTLDLEALARGGLEGVGLGSGQGPIVLAGGRLQVDRHLLLDSGAGPILSQPGARHALRAGADVQLRGGDLRLQGLDVQAGTAVADGRVWLRAGAGAGQGRLELVDSALQGPRLALEGASVRLDTVRLEGGDVRVRASGPLSASRLRVRATAQGAGTSGSLWLQAGPAPLRLDTPELDGRQVEIQSEGPVEWRQGRARAGGERASGVLRLTTAPGPGGAASPITLEGVRLSGSSLVVRAAGDLVLRDLGVEGEEMRLRAGRQLVLDGSQLRATGEQGHIQLEALSPPGGPPRGRLRLRSTQLAGQAIVGRAERALTLEGATLEAGEPGRRGLIRLETTPGTPGALSLRDSHLRGHWLLLRSGSLQLRDSQLEAPKGMLHLEARAGDLAVGASQLDVGVHDAADLRREVEFRFRPVAGVQPVLFAPDPGIALFAGRQLWIRGSRIDASQDVDALRGRNPALADRDVALTDASGLIVADAGGGVRVEESRIHANATDNLAGTIVLRARGQAEGDQLWIRDSSLGASGPLGSGDIRLNSASGIHLEGSRLQADATGRRADAQRPDQPSREAGFSGGEITLTNASTLRPIAIEASLLQAAQTFDASLLKPAAHPRTRTLIGDAYDDFDNGEVYTGGAITLLSAGGIRLRGVATTLTTNADPGASAQRDTIGGVIRIANTNGAPITIVDGAQLNASSNQALSPPSPGEARPPRGEINLWNRGPIEIRDARLDASTHFSVASATPSPEPHISLSLFSASRLDLQAATLLHTAPDGRNQVSVRTPPQGGDPKDQQAFATAFNAFFDSRFWGKQRQSFGRNYYLDPRGDDGLFQTADDGIQDQLIQGGGFVPISLATAARRLPINLSNIPGSGLIQIVLDAQPPQPLGRFSGPDLSLVQIPSLPRSVTAAPPPPLAVPEASFRPGTVSGPVPVARALSPAVATSQSLRDGAGQGAAVQTLSSADAVRTLLAEDQEATQAVSAALGLAQQRRHSWQVTTLRDGLQDALRRATAVRGASRPYRPGILQISLADVPGQSLVQINQILVLPAGEVQGWQTRVEKGQLQRTIRAVQRQFSLLEPDTDAAAAQLAATLLGPVLPAIRTAGVNALILSLDRGLQGIPFAALPLAGTPLGEELALTVTPALALTELAPARPATGERILLAGSGRFRNGLAPLPMARQEIERLAQLHPRSRILLDDAFEARGLLRAAVDQPIAILHLATHADFQGSKAGQAVIYTSSGDLSLKDMGQRLRGKAAPPIGLFVLNACRTSLGNEESELGITGLALQAGASSALGNLWYVDDAVTAAFAIEFHRALQSGLPKDLALQHTQRQFRSGAIRLRGDQIVNGNNAILLAGLSRAQQIMLDGKLSHPYYWSGIILSGTPW
jgi:CHAT domain-containing protein